ncbi:MAG TPA: NUDIX hydrolase [Magnetospirillaceae bacterium]
MAIDSITLPVAAVGAVIWKDDRVLLIRRGKAPRKGFWSLPGGRQQWGETVYEAVTREIMEETGVTIRILDVAAVIDLIHRDDKGAIEHHFTVIDVVAEWVSGEAVAGDDAAEVAWAAPDELARYELTPKMHEVIEIAAGKRKG